MLHGGRVYRGQLILEIFIKDKEMSNKIKTNPWFWIPTLYFAEGIPYFIVNQISIVMFTNMGVPKDTMALYTSLLYLPWVIKPFWSPFVDIFKTKRWWIIATQIAMSICFILLAFSFPSPSLEAITNQTTSISLFIISLIIFVLTAFASATHDIAADGFYLVSLASDEQTFFVGIRSTFYRLSSWFGQGVLVIFAGYLETRLENVPLAWRIVFILVAIMFALITLYHTFFLSRPKEDVGKIKDGEQKTIKDILNEFGKAFATFFKKPQVLVAIAFMLLFRLPEALMLKLVYPFFTDHVVIRGLGISTKAYGIIYGTVGIIALTIGGIFGGIWASKYGLKKVLWPMVACITLPCFVFVYMSTYQPILNEGLPLYGQTSFWILNFCIALEQLGYGIGFQAYMLYMMYFSDGEFKTSHYAICTGFMALGMMLPGMVSGYLCQQLGYVNFFWLGMATCIGTVIVTLMIKIDGNYGTKKYIKE